jgi:UPF0716 family protein affecting phage T7 exclusion
MAAGVIRPVALVTRKWRRRGRTVRVADLVGWAMIAAGGILAAFYLILPAFIVAILGVCLIIAADV